MHSIKQLFAPRDLTQGKPMTGLILFALPLLLGNIAQQLYSTVDAVVMGRYIGDAALGAVGLTGPIINLLLVLFMGVSTGASIVVSQSFGAKDRAALTRAVGTTISLTFISGVIVTVLGIALAGPLLTILDTPSEMMQMSKDYLIIILIGITGCAYYNILSGVLRGLGDSVSPLIYLLICTVLNIVLDIAFVTLLHMTTDGVALATILSQSVSAGLCFLRLRRMTDILDLNRSSLRVDKAIMRSIVKLGVPAGMTQMIFSLSNVLVQSLTNSLGGYVVTASTAIMRVDGFAMMPNFTFGIAATTFTGQNVGARRLDRVREGTGAVLRLALVASTVLTLGILIFGEGLMRIFTQTNAIVELGVSMMRLLAVGYIMFGVTQSLSGVMRGMGETVAPMWISIFITVVVRLPLAYLWAYLTRSPEFPNGSPVCLYGSLLVAWLLSGVITVYLFKRGKWRERAERGLRPEAPDMEGSLETK